MGNVTAKRVLNYKLFYVLLFALSGHISKAQQYFVRTDFMGYTYNIGKKQDFKQSMMLKYSLGAERTFDSGTISLGLLVNYGFLPYGVYEDSSPDGLNDFVQASVGFYALPEFRYYWRKNKPRYFKGAFAGGYWMYFNGIHYYDIVLPPNSGHREIVRAESRRFQLFALGFFVGYKAIVGKRFFIEPLIGFGKGKYFPKISDIGVFSFHAGNLLPRLGLGVGYCFQ
jgi:hypothetical protein